MSSSKVESNHPQVSLWRLVCLFMMMSIDLAHSFQHSFNMNLHGVKQGEPFTMKRLYAEPSDQASSPEAKKKKREKVMSFLRKVGAVGKNKDFTTAMGVDEGPVGKNSNPVKVS